MSGMIAIHQRTNDVLCKTLLVLSGGEYETQETAKYSNSKYTNEQNVMQMAESCVQAHCVGNQIILRAVHLKFITRHTEDGQGIRSGHMDL